MTVEVTFTAPQPRQLTDAGTCRHCGWTLRHMTLLDDNDQPVDAYLGFNEQGALDGTCYSHPDAVKCAGCAGTGDDPADPEWACEICDGRGIHADRQPAMATTDLATAIDLATGDYRSLDGGPDATEHDFVDAARNGGVITHDQVDRMAAAGHIDQRVANAYRAVLDATWPEINAALAQLAA